MTLSLIVTSYSLQDTHALAQIIASTVRAGDTLCFHGNLGAGKTCFIAYLIKALYEEVGLPAPDVTSPTFALVQEYQLPHLHIAHFDLYRLNVPQEIEQIGAEEFFEESLCLIEWSGRAEEYLPEKYLNIFIESIDDTKRVLTFVPVGGYNLPKKTIENLTALSEK